jgi:hypothetical protein
VTDSRHFYQKSSVVDGVHRAVVTDTNAPLALAAPEFLGARRTRIGGEIFQVRNEARDQLGGELFEFLLSS